MNIGTKIKLKNPAFLWWLGITEAIQEGKEVTAVVSELEETNGRERYVLRDFKINNIPYTDETWGDDFHQVLSLSIADEYCEVIP